MQQAEAASYLQQTVMLSFVSTDPCINIDDDHGWTSDGQGPPSRPRHDLGMRCSAVLPSHLSPHSDGRFGNLEPDRAVNLVQPRLPALHIHLVLIYTRASVGPRTAHVFNRSEVTRGWHLSIKYVNTDELSK